MAKCEYCKEGKKGGGREYLLWRHSGVFRSHADHPQHPPVQCPLSHSPHFAQYCPLRAPSPAAWMMRTTECHSQWQTAQTRPGHWRCHQRTSRGSPGRCELPAAQSRSGHMSANSRTLMTPGSHSSPSHSSPWWLTARSVREKSPGKQTKRWRLGLTKGDIRQITWQQKV